MGQMWQSMGLGRSTGSGNNGGMGGMMGGNGTGTTATTNLWIIPIALIAAVAIGTIGFCFYLVLPEIRNISRTCEPAKNENNSAGTTKTSVLEVPIAKVAPNSCEVILKTMT